MSYLSYTRDYTGPDQVILRTPERYMPLVAFLEQTSRQPSELTLAERELLASFVSALNASPFCVGIHNGVAHAFSSPGIDETALTTPLADHAIAEKLAPVFAMVELLVKTPKDFCQADVDKLIAAGWAEQTVEDIIGLVASVTVYNILSVGFGFKTAPSGYFVGLGQAVKEHGYQNLFQSMLDAAE